MSYFTSGHVTRQWGQSLDYITLSIVIAGALISLSVYVLSHCLVDKQIINGIALPSTRPKPRFMESVKYIFSSRYLMLIIVMVISYGVAINLLEGVWKKHVSLLYTNTMDYGHFFARIQIATSITSILCIGLSAYILRYFSWGVAAIITPVVMLVTGVPFFIGVIGKQHLVGFSEWIGHY